jgi:hypothetical protein
MIVLCKVANILPSLLFFFESSASCYLLLEVLVNR